MKTNIDLFRICTNTHYNNLFNTTWVEMSMTALAKTMILDGLY